MWRRTGRWGAFIFRRPNWPDELASVQRPEVLSDVHQQQVVAQAHPRILHPVTRERNDPEREHGSRGIFGNANGRLEITTDEQVLIFATSKLALRVPYDRVNLIEYGQKVDRRLGMAIIISPMFLLSKSRKHFLTVGFSDEEGRQQAVVFRVDKKDVRGLLVSLEARTGRKVEYQDEEARKAGKG